MNTKAGIVINSNRVKDVLDTILKAPGGHRALSIAIMSVEKNDEITIDNIDKYLNAYKEYMEIDDMPFLSDGILELLEDQDADNN